jgi:hypothetical protein
MIQRVNAMILNKCFNFCHTITCSISYCDNLKGKLSNETPRVFVRFHLVFKVFILSVFTFISHQNTNFSMFDQKLAQKNKPKNKKSLRCNGYG